MARKRRKIHFHPRPEKNIQRVFRLQTRPASRYVSKVFALPDDSFREQKARGQFAVVARRAHRYRHAPAAHADFQRLFNGD